MKQDYFEDVLRGILETLETSGFEFPLHFTVTDSEGGWVKGRFFVVEGGKYLECKFTSEDIGENLVFPIVIEYRDKVGKTAMASIFREESSEPSSVH